MSQISIPLTIEALKQIEVGYHEQLRRDPADTRARLSLAWCLVMQAVCAAGQESLLSSMPHGSSGLAEPYAGRMREALIDAPTDDSEQSRLIRSCLLHASAVRHLSADPAELSDVERLRDVIRRAGCGDTVAAADAQAARKLADLTEAIVGESRARPYVEASPPHN